MRTTKKLEGRVNKEIYRKNRRELTEVISFLSQKGWVPATSSNFSAKVDAEHISISRSGVDKSLFTEDDLILVNTSGAVLHPKGERSSAETLIHTTLYKHFETMRCVLHTHSIHGTMLSRVISKQQEFIQEGLLG